MKELWLAGKDLRRILCSEENPYHGDVYQSGAEHTEEIFDSYRKALGRKMPFRPMSCTGPTIIW